MPKDDVRLMIRLRKHVHAALEQIVKVTHRTKNEEIAFLIENLVITATADRGSPEFVQAANGLRTALMAIMPADKKLEDMNGAGTALVTALRVKPAKPASPTPHGTPHNGTV